MNETLTCNQHCWKHRFRLDNFFGHATPPFLASVTIRRYLSVVPIPQVTEHCVQSVHSVTTQSTISDGLFCLFDEVSFGWVVAAPIGHKSKNYWNWLTRNWCYRYFEYTNPDILVTLRNCSDYRGSHHIRIEHKLIYVCHKRNDCKHPDKDQHLELEHKYLKFKDLKFVFNFENC